MYLKILVLSDSHSSLRFMRDSINAVKPDVIAHLGDFYDDGGAMEEEYPHIRVYRVLGNGDWMYKYAYAPEVISCSIGGVKFFMTHGHNHGVKGSTSRLLGDARKSGAGIVLYGHTHEPECTQEEDGLWVLNPGSCRGYGGSVGIVEIKDKKISSCRILRQEDIEMLSAVNAQE